MEHLRREEIVELVYQAKAQSERDWVLLLVTFWHGLRASEALALTPGHFADGYLTIQRLKNSNRTKQKLCRDPDPVMDELPAIDGWIAQHRRAGRGERARLFHISKGKSKAAARIQFWRLMRRYGQCAGLPKHLCHPHVLKHSIAMLSLGAGIEQIQQYLGHKSLASTGAYFEVSDADAERAIERAVERSAPRLR